jgi:SAM-dependent methyltransferase
MPGFFDDPDGPTRGKSISALVHSKASRNDLLRLFGGTELIPSSVMRAKRPRISEKTDAPTASRSYDKTMPGAEEFHNQRLPDIVRKAHYISGRGTCAGALSTFPQEIGRSMVLLYSEPGQTVYDPFAGHNSRMDLCIRAGRDYTACDLSTEFMEFNHKRAEELRRLFPKRRIKLHHCDSRKSPVPNESADITITSPPYYDIEYYGDEPEQLGKAKTYRKFIKGIQQVLQENFRILRSGSFAIWFINDFRRKGKFHAYHVDLIIAGEAVGFEQHDLLVVDFGNSIRDCFTNQIITSKILPKRHEFGVVFRKP